MNLAFLRAGTTSTNPSMLLMLSMRFASRWCRTAHNPWLVARNVDAGVTAEGLLLHHNRSQHREASMTNENAHEKSARQQAQPEKTARQQAAQQQKPDQR